MSLIPTQRLNNLESGLVSAQKIISDLATDTELSSSSYQIENNLHNLKNAVDSIANQLDILKGILKRVESE